MKNNLIYISIAIIFIFLCATLYFYNNLNTHQKCPDEYSNTDKGSMEYQKDFDKWTNQFYDTHPDATLSELSKARYQYWIDNDCKEALERYKEAKDGNADHTKMNLIEDTIQETINNN